MLFLQYLFWILLFVTSAELLLEYRHYKLGYSTPLLGSKSTEPTQSIADSVAPASAVRYGPTDSFPFRSVPLSEEKQVPRVWIASASHAVSNRIAPDKIFPNMICLQPACEVINGSYEGLLIKDNVDLLDKYAADYSPDIAILYQMSMFIARESARQLTKGSTDGGGSNPIVDWTSLLTFFQRFSVYVHLSDVIGGNIKLQGQLKDAFPTDSLGEYESRLMMFISASRELGVRPILATFAASHDALNLNEMPFLQKTNFVKWVPQPYLSPIGWSESVDHLNKRIRTVASKERVQLIDIAMHLNGKPQYFVDFVHFNEAGHRVVADVIAEALSEETTKGFE